MVKAQNKESHMSQSHDQQDAQQVAKVTTHFVLMMPNLFNILLQL